MSEETKAAPKKQKTEREIFEEEEAARKVDIEKRRVHPQLGVPAIRFYQADDASEAPGAWYAAFHSGNRPDVRLHEADSKFMHDLAQRLTK